VKECNGYGMMCNTLLPYACVAGKSAGGCAESEGFWKNATFTGTCEKCCDTSTCFGEK